MGLPDTLKFIGLVIILSKSDLICPPDLNCSFRMEGFRYRQPPHTPNEDMRLLCSSSEALTLLKAVLHIFPFLFIDHKLWLFFVQEWHFSRSLFLALHEQYLCFRIHLFYNRQVTSAFFTFSNSLFCILSL